MSEIFVEMVDLIEQVTDVPAEEISNSSRFESLANWTSLAALRLLTGIESRFSIHLDLREYFAIENVGELVSAVSSARA